MNTLVTGITGSIGRVLAPALRDAGHDVRGFTRNPDRPVSYADELATGDVTTGAGLEAALEGIDVAYYLVHSMETAAGGDFEQSELRAADNFARAAAGAGVRRIVYLGGPVPSDGTAISRHLRSRVAVEETLLGAVPSAIAFRASVVISAGSRSFLFLVRLVERVPVLPMPAWTSNRSMPIDGRDITDYLVNAATAPDELAGSWDAVGPEVMRHGQLLERIADAMMVGRPSLRLGFSLTPVAAPVAAAVAGEDLGLIEPLMESLESELLPRNEDAAEAFGVHLHTFDAAVERALRDLEATEEVRAR